MLPALMTKVEEEDLVTAVVSSHPMMYQSTECLNSHKQQVNKNIRCNFVAQFGLLLIYLLPTTLMSLLFKFFAKYFLPDFKKHKT